MSTNTVDAPTSAPTSAPIGAPGRDRSNANASDTAAEAFCAHCSLPVPPGLVDASAEHQFCCTGCQTVYGILHEHGLQRYYGFATKREVAVRTSGQQFDAFDHEAYTERYVTRLPNGLARTELYLEGLHCASCVWLVERTPLVVPGVVRADLNLRRALAVVEWDPARVSLSTIATTLDTLGYTPHPFRAVAQNTMRTREDRAMLVRIGVAGAIAINVMLASLALYSGEWNTMDAAYTRFFRWVCLALMIPAYLWPGRVFFTGAWAALRTRALHMDLPIAIALAAGFARGAANTITDSGPVYFDGLAVLIFALLVGRFLQQRGQRMASDAAELLHALAPSSARIVVNSGTVQEQVKEIPTHALLPGMLMDVRAGESFAADGVVVYGHTTVNSALLTGESQPVAVGTGDTVYAGTHNVEAPVRVQVECAGETSRIAKLMQQVDEGIRRRAPVVQLANRMAGWFIAVVLTAAFATWAIKTSLHLPSAFDDAIALLIVTCPCALALSTPLAMTVAIGRAAGRGMLIKGGDALELLATPRTPAKEFQEFSGILVLDKTGTVTEGATALQEWHGPEWVKSLVVSLEHGSSHPLAEGFRRAFHAEPRMTVTQARTTVGGGVEGVVNGHDVRIGSPRFVLDSASQRGADNCPGIDLMDPTLTPVYIAVDGVLVASAGFGDTIRPDALSALRTLRAAGWRTVLLSGDTPQVAQAVGAALEFAPADVIGGATPENKRERVAQYRQQSRVVMVGDGVNDAAAIAAADVGIGVHGGAEACLATADIFLTTPGLSGLVELMNGARRTMRVIHRNIAFSIAYNIVGATLAVAGVLSPLVAAVLMPASSITVVLGAWYGHSFSRNRT